MLWFRFSFLFFSFWFFSFIFPSLQGAAISGGPVWLLLGEFSAQAEALALYDQLRQNGYPARLQPLGHGDRLRYRVRITDFADTDDARATLQRLRQQLNTPLGDIRTR